MSDPRWYLVRATGWVVLLPVAVALGWQTSVFLVFVLSVYANFATDLGAYQAARARQASEEPA